ncbi:MAG: hypothetical protein FJ276_22235 [Planctomycetes bacterium]|nr:hypothetical protein [Planctomycetota bacterium]
MKRLPTVVAAIVLGIATCSPAGEPAREKVTPSTPVERASVAKLTRLRNVRMRWDEHNRVTGISMKGADANDWAVALASNLPTVKSMTLVTLPHNGLSDGGLAPLMRLTGLELLSISGNQISDAGLLHLAGKTRLHTLILNGNFTDAGLVTISSLPNLEHLDMTQAHVTDLGMTHVANIPNLHTLILNGTQITSGGIEQLIAVNPLTHLHLANTRIDDSAAEHLTKLKGLKTLNIHGTAITQQKLLEMQSAFFADCEIIHHTMICKGTGGARNGELDFAQSPSTSVPVTTWRAPR